MTVTHLSLLLTSIAVLLLPATLGCSPAQNTTEIPAGAGAPQEEASASADGSANQPARDEPIAASEADPGIASAPASEATPLLPAGSAPAPSETEAADAEETLPHAADEGVFVVEGHCSVASPGNGYNWAEVGVREIGGITGRYLACRKEGSTSGITLVIEHRRADSDGERIAAAKGHFNGLVQSLKRGGFTELKGKVPSLEPPMPEHVDYAIHCLKPSGDPMYFRCATIFGNNIYAFQVIADTDKEAAYLYSAVNTLREIEDQTHGNTP